MNVIVWPDHLERYRRAVLGGNLLTVYGTWQRDTDTGGQVMNLLAQRIVDHTHLLGKLRTTSRDFRCSAPYTALPPTTRPTHADPS